MSTGAPAAKHDVYLLTVGPSYFETMQIPVLLGRGLKAPDMDGDRVVVNELFAKANFGGDSPLGRHFTLDDGPDARDRSSGNQGQSPAQAKPAGEAAAKRARSRRLTGMGL